MQKLSFNRRCAFSFPFLFFIIGLFIGIVHTSPAFAELGGAVTHTSTSNIAQPQNQTTVQSLHVFQTKNPSGTQIKEYANAEGMVVAVSWQGPALPNLKQLLGNYFEPFTNRSPSTVTGLRNAEIHTDDLVVQSHGQLRSFAGRAYLPKLLPTDVDVDQIK